MDVSHVSVGLVGFLSSGVSNGVPLPNPPYCFLSFFDVPYESHIRRKVPFIRQQLKPRSNASRGLGRRKFDKPKPILSAIMEVKITLFSKGNSSKPGKYVQLNNGRKGIFFEKSCPDTAGYFFGHLKLAKIKALIFPKIGRKYPFSYRSSGK